MQNTSKICTVSTDSYVIEPDSVEGKYARFFITVQTSFLRWEISRRYRLFLELHQELAINLSSSCSPIPLPLEVAISSVSPLRQGTGLHDTLAAAAWEAMTAEAAAATDPLVDPPTDHTFPLEAFFQALSLWMEAEWPSTLLSTTHWTWFLFMR